MMNKISDTTFQCDSCFDVFDQSEYHELKDEIFVCCNQCHSEIMNEQKKRDDEIEEEEEDEYDPSDYIYEQWIHDGI